MPRFPVTGIFDAGRGAGLQQRSEHKSTGVPHTVFTAAKSEFNRVTDFVFVPSEGAAAKATAPAKTPGDVYRQSREELARQLKALRSDLDNDKISPQEKAAKIAKVIPEISSLRDKIIGTGRVLIKFDRDALNGLLETLNNLKTGYSNQPVVSATPAAPVTPKPATPPPAAAKPVPDNAQQIRQQFFKIMNTIAKTEATNQAILQEQRAQLINAYKLLQGIPDKDKTVQDLAAIMTCANLLGDKLHKLQDPRAADIVKMGMDYCNKVLASPDNRYFNALQDINGLNRQFIGNQTEMRRFIFARADAFEQLGNIYKDQNNPEAAIRCFRAAQTFCLQAIPENFHFDDVKQRVNHYQYLESKVKGELKNTSTTAVMQNLYTKTQLAEIAEAKKNAPVVSTPKATAPPVIKDTVTPQTPKAPTTVSDYVDQANKEEKPRGMRNR